jgi:hypothetical protein
VPPALATLSRLSGGKGRGCRMRPKFAVMFALMLALVAGMVPAGAAAASPASRHVRSAADPGASVPAFGHVFLIIGASARPGETTPATAACRSSAMPQNIHSGAHLMPAQLTGAAA